MTQKLFTTDGAWSGGFYELALELGPRCGDRQLDALKSAWEHPDLDGCWLDPDREPENQPRVLPFADENRHMLGVATLPNGCRVACGTFVIPEVDHGPDWLGFFVPMGALGTAYPTGGFPFALARSWRTAVDDWLLDIARTVARSAEFRLGLIGHEVSGRAYADEVLASGIPEVRDFGYLWPSGGDLTWSPPTLEI